MPISYIFHRRYMWSVSCNYLCFRVISRWCFDVVVLTVPIVLISVRVLLWPIVTGEAGLSIHLISYVWLKFLTYWEIAHLLWSVIFTTKVKPGRREKKEKRNKEGEKRRREIGKNKRKKSKYSSTEINIVNAVFGLKTTDFFVLSHRWTCVLRLTNEYRIVHRCHPDDICGCIELIRSSWTQKRVAFSLWFFVLYLAYASK